MNERLDVGQTWCDIGMSLDALHQQVKSIIAKYPDREKRARRIFIEDRAEVLREKREVEFDIKSDVSEYFSIPYTAVAFCGSAQLGFSVHKNKVFDPSTSDLDVACISVDLFQKAWRDVVKTTKSFNDLTPFGRLPPANIDGFKEQILNRGMINVSKMPISNLSRSWIMYQDQLSRKYAASFQSISFAVYMNEYAFCWKQDSALSDLVG